MYKVGDTITIQGFKIKKPKNLYEYVKFKLYKLLGFAHKLPRDTSKLQTFKVTSITGATLEISPEGDND